MKVSDLLKNIEIQKVYGDLNQDCENVVINSNNVTKNSLFLCLKGTKYDGNDYVNYAIKNGANVIVTENDYYIPNVLVVKVKNARKAFSIIASNFYGNPSNNLKIIAIVGTNGKSTTAYLIYELLKKANIEVGLIGTMYCKYKDVTMESKLTTPDPMDLNMILKDMVDRGVKYVVMEASAHAIYLHKLYGIKFYIKIFTNFSQDHLDFFNSMKEYGECKKSFFIEQDSSKQIVNMDDKLGLEIIKESKNEIITYGLSNPSDVFCINIENKTDGSIFILNLFDNIMEISSRLFGVFNIYNTMAAAICVKLIGVNDIVIANALCEISPPEGRFNVFDIKGVKYIVDFAHTPDGLYNLLLEIRKIAKGRIITVFGCGGDRDITKRPIMGSVASEMSDIVIITSDNPRTEDRMSIIEDILEGVKHKEKIYIQQDRKLAIKQASVIARKEDIVIIAGKGSENYIDENNFKTPYSDISEVMKIRC